MIIYINHTPIALPYNLSTLPALRSDPPEGIQACPLDELSVHWQASIRGPAGSPYEGGTFFLYIQIPHR